MQRGARKRRENVEISSDPGLLVSNAVSLRAILRTFQRHGLVLLEDLRLPQLNSHHGPSVDPTRYLGVNLISELEIKFLPNP